MAWRVSVSCDIIKGQFHEGYKACVYWELFWVMACGYGEVYRHFYSFGDDWEKADRLVKQIVAYPDFTPRNKPGVWFRVYDTQPLRPFTWKPPLMYLLAKERTELGNALKGGKGNG